jgi:CheY-like chemotaxis protein
MQSNSVAILLVEDEPIHLDNMREAFEEAGFRTLLAVNAQEAVSKLEEYAAEVAGVITDISMGNGLTGWDVARRARQLKSDMPIVYITGANADQWSVQGVPKSLLVEKPMALAQLVAAISTLLTAGSSSLSSQQT